MTPKKRKITKRKSNKKPSHKHQYVFLEYLDPEHPNHIRTPLELCIGCKNLKGLKVILYG